MVDAKYLLKMVNGYQSETYSADVFDPATDADVFDPASDFLF